MIEREQFIDEFFLNVEEQGFESWAIKSMEDDLKIINKIYLEYLYQVVPMVAIYMDPKIIAATRIETVYEVKKWD